MVKDIRIEDTGDTIEDVLIQNGDFLVDVSDQQHIQHLLKANKGQYYQWPLIGMGIMQWNNAPINPASIKQQISIQLKADNYRPKKIMVDREFKIFIDAERLK